VFVVAFEFSLVLMFIVDVKHLFCDVFASVDELTNDIEKLREAEKSNQETISHYEAEFKVSNCMCLKRFLYCIIMYVKVTEFHVNHLSCSWSALVNNG